MLTLPPALAPMGAYKQFICYVVQPSTSRPGKTDKMPVDWRTGRVVSAHDSQYWTDAQTAITGAERLGKGHGVGFVFTEHDPFGVLDIDHCLQADGTWSPLALSLCQALAGAGIEVSHSNAGLHVFFTYTSIPDHAKKPPDHIKSTLDCDLELYHTRRFIALTGTGAIGNAAHDLTHLLPSLITQFFPPSVVNADAGEGRRAEWCGPEDDDKLIERMLRSRSTASAFGGKASILDLWTGNADALGKAFPDADGKRPWDFSSADAALAQHLAFWTGCDNERMERIMFLSSLVRDKWERSDYLPRTIAGACNRQFEVLQDKPLAVAATVGADGFTVTPVNGSCVANPEDQKAIFEGCVYVQSQSAVLTDKGHFLARVDFDDWYGRWSFVKDRANGGMEKSAWNAFVKSQCWNFPRVEQECFRPHLPFGHMFIENGRSVVNTFYPIQTPCEEGDCSIILTHISKLMPVQSDADIFISHLACQIQHPGYKIPWCPVLQGTKGNGKSEIGILMERIIGYDYSHRPNAADINNRFNGWMRRKLFIILEELGAYEKRETMETLKPMIANERLESQKKGGDQITIENTCNFLICVNEQGAVPVDDDERRYAIFHTAQQHAVDLVRDKMTGVYFQTLRKWIRTCGPAHFHHYLKNYKIRDELNPTILCGRAPYTSSMHEAIQASHGAVEQEILEAVAQGLPGFKAGFISSNMLAALLDNSKLSHSKRKRMLENLGYIHHPGLAHGPASRNVMPDNGKPTLFVQKNSEYLALRDPAEVTKAYEQTNAGREMFPVAR